MGWLKKLFDFYINASIHVALAICSLIRITQIYFDLELDKNLYFFVFFASISAYNFIKYFGIAKFHHRSLSSWLRGIQIFSFVCFLSLIYFSLKIPEELYPFLLFLSVICFFYAIPFIPKKYLLDASRNIRSITGMKIYVICLMWMAVTVLLPLKYDSYSLDIDVWLEIIKRFLFVLIAILPFEIRDLQYDSLKLATIPQKIGIRRTKVLGVVLTILFFGLNFFKDELETSILLIELGVSLLLLIFLWASKIDSSKYFTQFWVESVPIFWVALLYIFQ